MIYLGRPWRDYAKTAFIECELDENIHPEGWHNWGKIKAEIDSTYVEYGNTGAGADTSARVSFCKPMTNSEATAYYCLHIKALMILQSYVLQMIWNEPYL